HHGFVFRRGDLRRPRDRAVFRQHRDGQGLPGADGRDAALRGADLVDELPGRRHLRADRSTGEGGLMAATLATPTSLPVRSVRNVSRGFWWEAWSRLRLNKAAMAGLVFILILVAMAILAPLLTPYSYADGNLLAGTQGPSREHLLGTDQLGRD